VSEQSRNSHVVLEPGCREFVEANSQGSIDFEEVHPRARATLIHKRFVDLQRR
jgi:hypothetical protein